MGAHVRYYKAKNNAHKVGKFDQHGNKIETVDAAAGYSGALYNSREEAVDLRKSKGVETKKDNRSVFGGKRANLFGN